MKLKNYSLLFLLLMASIVHAEGVFFDTFFTNAKTRAGLDDARIKFRIDTNVPIEEEDLENIRNIRVNGFIIGPDGKSKIWVNNDSEILESSPVENMQLKSVNQGSPAVTMKITGGNNVELKPGEIYSLETGVIRDAYEIKQAEPAADLAVEEQVEDAEQLESEAEEFDETKLAQQDERIQLLEERLEQLESSLR